MMQKAIIFNFRKNDLDPSKGKQIEFNSAKVEDFFSFSSPEVNLTLRYVQEDSTLNGTIVKTYLKFSPERRDYKIYQNTDSSPDLKDFFRNSLGLNENNINDYFALKKVDENNYDFFYFPRTTTIDVIYKALKLDKSQVICDIENNSKNDSSVTIVNHTFEEHRQLIFFGAPGTGKSFLLNEKAKAFGKCVERVTFHPNYSFAQFVGTYKPVQDELDSSKIRYQYVPGPFMRTYVKAFFNEEKYKERVNEIVEAAINGSSTGAELESNYYVAPCNLEDWDFFENVDRIGKCEWWRNPPTGENCVKKGDIVFVYVGKKGIEAVNDPHKPGIYAVASVVTGEIKEWDEKKWVELRYEDISLSEPFVSLKDLQTKFPSTNPIRFQSTSDGVEILTQYKNVFGNYKPRNRLLLIEEINRANVAAVFGDVFQLLDRKIDGESEYPVAASEDIKRYLKDNGIADCNELRIPSNMYIWATMNSADQGVFPMDTAFKRRWEFEYIDIDHKESIVEDYLIPIKNVGSEYSFVKWNLLRKKINDCLSNIGINEDKLMGPFFVNKGSMEALKNLLTDDLKKENDAGDGSLENPICYVLKEDVERKVKSFRNSFCSKVLMYLFEDAARMHRGSIFRKKGSSSALRYSEVCKNFKTSDLNETFVFDNR